eukprot:TRINITY_DN3915_c0_g1_i2.p1 TRINITY_DN3915_c0_g1~~TRINITY_DN3915_c0_g1_i2.p1  ORF type:complete len:340 (+),score=77.27 TRINITY_DN3915_c0_g1_i2:221-1240(+)
MAGALEGDVFVGERAEQHRGLMRLNYPVQRGTVTDWTDAESLWRHMYASLKLRSEDHPALLTESPFNPTTNRMKLAELFFETFSVPALSFSTQALLSLYASGRTTGVVLDVGDGLTHAVPVYEGYALQHAVTRSDLGGRDVTGQLQLLLRKAGFPTETSAEREVVRTIKERVCFVSPSVRRGNARKRSEAGPLPSGVPEAPVKYELPDGSVISVGSERHQATEVLFHPAAIGRECASVAEVVHSAIAKSDLDVRSHLYQNIVLAGGSTLFRGFGERLLNEQLLLAPPDIKIKISALQDRQWSGWCGGSILASLSSFKKLMITTEEYAEDPDCVRRKGGF